MTRTLGDRVADPALRDLAMRDLLDVQVKMDLVHFAQHARDRREERPFVEMGCVDVGGEGG
ncbi:MAG TPA: hypothetical protein VJU58_13695 [Microbacterium sp.]|nr:hypothetical protein [Microbacterium sp.]